MKTVPKWLKIHEAKLFIALKNDTKLDRKNFWNSDDEWIAIFDENNLSETIEED